MFILILFFIFLSNQTSICDKKHTCSECIIADPKCAWCFDENFSNFKTVSSFRCGLKADLLRLNCSSLKIEDFSSTISESGDHDIMPKNSDSKLRINSHNKFNFKFITAKTYPIDLYFLVDASHTMRNLLTNVSRMTYEILDTSKDLTDDLYLGFGLFVDKPVIPFVQESFGCMENSQGKCFETFLIKHILPLTNNFTNFQERTRYMTDTANLDSPEGGLDAALQLILCQKEIGWRTKARKVVVYASDGLIHVAGDGKTAGIIRPAPNECKLEMKFENEDPYWHYPDSHLFDYPSIAENGVSMIFAVSKETKSFYEKLANYMTSASVGVISDNGRDIIDLLNKNLKEIASKIEFIIEYDSDYYEVNSQVSCNGKETWVDGRICENVSLNQELEIKLVVKPIRCNTDGNSRPISVHVFGYEETESIIKIETYCSCEKCNSPASVSKTSSECSQNGKKICGICECSQGYQGSRCQCKEYNEQFKCSNNDGICSSRGSCSCNECLCNSPKIIGNFCECKQCKLSSINKEPCGGPSYGTCSCDGKCKCNKNFSGEACDCLENFEACKSEDGSICSNNGECSCGACYCNQNFDGKFCEKASSEESTSICQSLEIQNCIACIRKEALESDGSLRKKTIKSGLFSNETSVKNLKESYLLSEQVKEKCQQSCIQENVNLNRSVIESKGPIQPENFCVIYDGDCQHEFSFRTDFTRDPSGIRKEIIMTIYNQVICSKVWPFWYYILLAFLIVLISGIVLLCIYKLITKINPTETANILIEEPKNEINQNPLFNQSITIDNPMHQKESDYKF